MKTRYKNLFFYLILIILFGLSFDYINKNIPNFKNFLEISLIDFILLLIFAMFFLFSNGIILKYLLKPFNINLQIKEWLGLTSITSFLNYITPFRGGIFIKALYLKNKYNFLYLNFLSTLSSTYILIFLISSLFSLISLFLIYIIDGFYSLILTISNLIIFLGLLIIIILSPNLQENKNKFINKFIKIINSLNYIKSNKKIIFVICLITTSQLLLGSLMIMLEFKIFGVEINFIEGLLLSSLSNLSLAIGITPGALGIKEAVIIFSSKIIGIMPIQAFSASILDRLIIFIPCLILGPIFSYILFKKAIPTTNEKNP